MISVVDLWREFMSHRLVEMSDIIQIFINERVGCVPTCKVGNSRKPRTMKNSTSTSHFKFNL